MRNRIGDLAMAILIGSIWGFLEATLGGLLHIANFFLTGQIMSAVGFALLFMGSKNGLSSRHLVLASAIAASFKLTDSFLFALPLNHITIINPIQAIMTQGLCFAALLRLFRGRTSTLMEKFTISAIAFPLTMIMFNVISILVLNSTQEILRGITINLPIGIFIATLSMALIEKSPMLLTKFKPSWQLAASTCFLAVTFVLRGIIVQ